jgi:hypothetical protein
LNYRVEIAAHHGPNGVLSLIRAAAGVGGNNLNALVAFRYPALLPNYNYSSSATILAMSIAVKKQIIVYQNLRSLSSSGQLRNVAAVQRQFVLDGQIAAASRVYVY